MLGTLERGENVVARLKGDVNDREANLRHPCDAIMIFYFIFKNHFLLKKHKERMFWSFSFILLRFWVIQ